MLESATGFKGTTSSNAYGDWAKNVEKAVMRHSPDERTAGPIPTFSKMFNLADLYSSQTSVSSSLSKNDTSMPAGPDDGYSFADVIDMINPLQHIPVIGSFYRNLTGDTIKGMSSIIGGALFGGPIGAVVSTANVIVKDRTGMDAAENLAAFAGLGPSRASIQKPEITYAPSAKQASAAYELTAGSGKRNFAAQNAAAVQVWNS